MDRASLVCLSCGASNPPQAAWCGRCFTTLEPDLPPPPQGWTCRVCRSVNVPSASTCGTCGAEIFSSFGGRDGIVLPGEALRASAVPGMGLVRVGMRVEGTLVLVLFLFAASTGWFVVAAGSSGGWVLVLAAVVLWLVATRDAYVVASRLDEPWLESRIISLVAGLIIIVAAVLVLRTPLSWAS